MDDGCCKTSAGAVAARLPDDLLVEILSRVPAKSVCRFKCVSKAWRDLIADHGHRKKLRQAMQGLFVMTMKMLGKTPEPFSFVDLTAGSVPLDVLDDPGLSFLLTGERPELHNLIVMDSCNGLILFGHHREPPDYVELDDIVCNPTTKQWTCVPIVSDSFPDRSQHTFLAFDPAVSCHFHLVQFQISMEEETLLALHAEQTLLALHVYSSETGTWSPNQFDSEQEEQGILAGWHRHVTLSYSTPRAFVNGLMYLIVQDLDQHHQQRIVALDVQGKARRMIQVPAGMAPDEGHFSYHLEQSQGCLHCITKELVYAPQHTCKLSIWVLQDYDDTQEWVLKNTVSSLEVFGELTCSPMDIWTLTVVDIHQDRNLVFLLQYDFQNESKLIAFNMDNKEVSVIATFEEQRTPVCFARYVPCFSECRALTS